MLPLALLTLIPLAAAHGVVTSPSARTPGAATSAACGTGMVAFYEEDPTSYPEALLRANALTPDYNADECNLWLCKGYQFEDNVENVMNYTPGEVVDMEVFIRIPHIGYANVSVVDVSSNEIVGDMLKVWEDGTYADGRMFPDLPEDNTKFSVTVPELEGKCTVAGECVIQWHWWGQGQTYQSCIDFTVPEPAMDEPIVPPMNMTRKMRYMRD